MARVTASLVEWIDDKGYGFARQPGGTERVFVHVKSFSDKSTRPKKGDELEFEIVPGRNGRSSAEDIKILGAAELAKILPVHLVTAAILLIFAQTVVMLGQAPFGLVVTYAAMGGLSLFLYSRDKKAAIDGGRRISENRLLLVDFFGGIIGGLLAQFRYRHKMSKPSFQIRTMIIVAFHAAFLGALGSGIVNLNEILASITGF